MLVVTVAAVLVYFSAQNDGASAAPGKACWLGNPSGVGNGSCVGELGSHLYFSKVCTGWYSNICVHSRTESNWLYGLRSIVLHLFTFSF